MDTARITFLLLSERVPLGYDYEQSEAECRRLVPEFLKEDPWASSLGPRIGASQLDELSTRLVAWVRAKGYPVMDEPFPLYGTAPTKSLGAWKPVKA